ncbi:MAG TPA: hypothetical protein VMY98_03690 [Anaerolineae bacterium]|nr:hypothetical protein [Anaerolineae bacterium]
MRADSDTLDQVRGRIPVDDPEAALRFCRSMARALESHETGTESLMPSSPGGTSAGEAYLEYDIRRDPIEPDSTLGSLLKPAPK